MSRPEKVSGVPPVYTEEARKARLTGVVILEAIIDEQGDVMNTRVLKGLPMGLSEAAMAAIRTWKFKPATLEGRPVKVYYTLTVNFQVDSPLKFGPQFRKFLDQNPDFAERLHGNAYAAAAELLDRRAAERPADPDLHLARCYLFLVQGRFEDAWQEALSYRGSEPYEVLQIVAYYAGDRAAYEQNMDAEKRAEVVELGLQAEAMAMAARHDTLEAIVIKSQLLQAKAKLTSDPAEKDALNGEVQELRTQFLDLQARARAAGTPALALSPILGWDWPAGADGTKGKS